MHISEKLTKKKPVKRKILAFQKSSYQNEVDYPPWLTRQRVLDSVMSFPESMAWNSVLAVLTLSAIVILSMDYESNEIVFGVRTSKLIDHAYNIMYGVHLGALVLASCYKQHHEKRSFSGFHWFWYALDAATYLHYLKPPKHMTKHFDFPYVITMICYYVRMRRSFTFLLGLNDYYMKGSIVGLMLKYWYIFLMLRVIYSNAFVWLGLTKEVVYKFIPSTLNKTRAKLFFRAFYMMDKRFLPIGMDRPADSDLNRVTSMIVIVSGSLLVTGVSIASLALLISVYMKFEQSFRARFRLIMDYMMETNVPAPLRQKVETFYKMYWHKQKAVSVTELLPTYPPTLNHSLNTDIYFEAMQKSQILRDLSYEFLTEVAKYMKTIHYMPGDVIIQRNTLKSYIVYISYGDVEMVTAEDDETPILRFTCGSILNPCGACMDVACSTAHVSVRAATFCSAHELQTADVWRVAVRYGKLNGQSYIMHATFDEHMERVVRHYAERPHPPVKYKSSILQLKRNLIELKEARDKDGKLIMNLNDKFLHLANCYFMRNVHTYYIVFTQSWPSNFVFFNFVVTVIYILDIVVHLSSGVKIEEGVPVTFLQTSSRQMRSFWFVFDVLAAAPIFEFIGDGTFAGMNKLCKLPHVFRTIKLLEETFVVFSSTLRLISFCLLMVVVTWLVAALNHGFLCFKLNFCRILSFVDSDAWEFNKTAKTDSELTDLIIYSNFWSISFTTFTNHLTAVGSMVHFPTQAETMAILEFCALLHIFVLAAYAATIMVTEQLSDKYEACIRSVKHFLQTNNIHRALQERFINYLQLCWFTNKAYGITHEESSILFDLPQHVYHDVITLQRTKYLLYIPFMKELPQSILKGISLRTQVFYTSPNEILLNTGDMCNEIYVIKQGFCEVINPDTKKVVSIITSKKHFGDIECLLRIPAFYTVRAVTHVELYFISRKHLTGALAMPKMRNTIRDVKKEPQYRELIVNRRQQFLTYEKPLPSVSRIKFPLPRRHEPDTAFLEPFQRVGFFSVFRYVFPRFTIHPDGAYLRKHECFRAACAFISAILWPACFLLSMQYGKWFYNFTSLLDFAAYFDIFQRMLVGYYNQRGILVYHPASTAAHYIKGALLVDLLACLPLEYMDDITFYYSLNKNYKIVPQSMEILLFNRCLQLYRLPCALGMLDKYIKRRDILYSIKVIPMFVVLISAVGTLIAIFSAYKILFKKGGGILKVRESRFPSWIYYNATNVGYNITKTAYNLWLTTNYWATSQLTNTGLGLFVPHCVDLLAIFILGMLAAKILVMYLSVRVISLRSNVNDALALFKIHMNDIITFMKREKFPKDLQREVQSYYNYTWSHTGGTDYQSVFKLCDQITLRTDAILHIYGQTFKMCPILYHCDISLLRLLGRAVNSVYWCENMKVIDRNDVISELFFVDYGTILVCDPNDDDVNTAVLSYGSVFGNMENIEQVVCPNSFVAGSNVHLLKIDAWVFYRILKDFPEVRANLKNYRPDDENYVKSRDRSKIFIKERTLSIVNLLKSTPLAEFLYNHNSIIPLYLIVICLICVFLDVYNAGFQCNGVTLITVLYSLDLAFALKLLIFIKYPYIFDPRIDSRLASRKAKKRYLHGKFKYDVISLLPLELFSLCFHKPWNWFACFRLNRFLRVVTVHRCLKHWKQLTTGMMTLAITGLATCFALSVHTFTCIWYYLAEVQDKRKPRSSWRWNKMYGEKENTTTTVCYNSQYVCAMYFIIINFMRNGGVNDILPRHHIEVQYICLLMIVSTVVCMIYVGEFCHVFHYHSWCCLNFYYKFLELQEFLKNNCVSRNLVNQTKKYSVYLWREARGRQIPHYVNSAPQCLRLKIMSAAYMQHLKMAHIFKHCEPAFLRQLVGHFQPYYYDENMYVVREGEITNSMYFVHKGRVKELSENFGEKSRVYQAGSYFGTFHGLYHNYAYTYSYKAEIKSQVLTLSLDSWEYLLRHYPANIKNVYREVTDPRIRDDFPMEQSGPSRMFPPKSLMKPEEKSNINKDQLPEISRDESAPTDTASTKIVTEYDKSQDIKRLIKELKEKVGKSKHFDEKLFIETTETKSRSSNESPVTISSPEPKKKVNAVLGDLKPVTGAITKTQSQPTPHSTDTALVDNKLEDIPTSGIISKPQARKLNIKESRVFFQNKSLDEKKDTEDQEPVSIEEKIIPTDIIAEPKTLSKGAEKTSKETDLAHVQPLVDSTPTKTGKVEEVQRRHELDTGDFFPANIKRATSGSKSIEADTLLKNADVVRNEENRASSEPLATKVRGNKELPKFAPDKRISDIQDIISIQGEENKITAAISTKIADVSPKKREQAFEQPDDAIPPNAKPINAGVPFKEEKRTSLLPLVDSLPALDIKEEPKSAFNQRKSNIHSNFSVRGEGKIIPAKAETLSTNVEDTPKIKDPTTLEQFGDISPSGMSKDQDHATSQLLVDNFPAKAGDVEEILKSKQTRHESEIRDILPVSYKRVTPASISIRTDSLPMNANVMLKEQNRSSSEPLGNLREIKGESISDFDKHVTDTQEFLPIREGKKAVASEEHISADPKVKPKKKDFAPAQPVDAVSPSESLEIIPRSQFVRRKSTVLGIDRDAIRLELESIKTSDELPSTSLQKDTPTTRSSLDEIELRNITYSKEDNEKELKKPAHSLKRDLRGKSSFNLLSSENRSDESHEDKERPTTSTFRKMDTKNISSQESRSDDTKSGSTKQTTINLKASTVEQHLPTKEQKSIRMILPQAEITDTNETPNLDKGNLRKAKDSDSKETKRSLKMVESLYSLADVEEYLTKTEQRKSKEKKKKDKK